MVEGIVLLENGPSHISTLWLETPKLNEEFMGTNRDKSYINHI